MTDTTAQNSEKRNPDASHLVVVTNVPPAALERVKALQNVDGDRPQGIGLCRPATSYVGDKVVNLVVQVSDGRTPKQLAEDLQAFLFPRKADAPASVRPASTTVMAWKYGELTERATTPAPVLGNTRQLPHQGASHYTPPRKATVQNTASL